jgi:hypothetical protein
MTAGGLGSNHEFSACLLLKFDEDGDNEFISDFESCIAGIIDCREVTSATKDLIEAYRTEYYFHKLHKDIAGKKAEKAIARVAEDLYEYYRVILEKHKEEPEPGNFSSDVQRRLENRVSALEVLKGMRRQAPWTREGFLEQHRLLVSGAHRYFYSDGIQRSQEAVADDRADLVAGLVALEALLKRGSASPAQAYDTLRVHFLKVKGAGVNLITEILHAYDNNSYTVMNGLSVEQLRWVSDEKFPSNLDKKNVTGNIYEAFCKEAKKVCKALNLRNYTEFDALMNYDYWS